MNISEGCNLTCPYCFAGQGKYGLSKTAWMPEDEAYTTTKEALRRFAKIRVIKLFGGEPLMNPHAIRGVCRAVNEIQSNDSERNISIGAVTNMTIFSPTYVKIFKENNISLTVSVDGPKAIHDHFRKYKNGNGSYDRIVNNINKYRENGLSIDGFESVYTPYEMNQGITVSDVAEFLISKFNAQWIHIVPAAKVDWSSTATDSDDNIQQLYENSRTLFRDCVDSAEPARKSLVQEILQMLFAKENGVHWCGLGQSQLTVAADGSVYPCYMFLNDRRHWELSSDIQSLSTSSIPDMIKKKISSVYAGNDKHCQRCPLQEICRGCPGAYYEQGECLRAYDPAACAFKLGSVKGILEGWRQKYHLKML